MKSRAFADRHRVRVVVVGAGGLGDGEGRPWELAVRAATLNGISSGARFYRRRPTREQRDASRITPHELAPGASRTSASAASACAKSGDGARRVMCGLVGEDRGAGACAQRARGRANRAAAATRGGAAARGHEGRRTRSRARATRRGAVTGMAAMRETARAHVRSRPAGADGRRRGTGTRAMRCAGTERAAIGSWRARKASMRSIRATPGTRRPRSAAAAGAAAQRARMSVLRGSRPVSSSRVLMLRERRPRRRMPPRRRLSSRVPAVDLALARGRGTGCSEGVHVAAHEARTPGGPGRRSSPRARLAHRRLERRRARRRHEVGAAGTGESQGTVTPARSCGVREAALEARERSREASISSAMTRWPNCRVGLGIAVGVDEQLVDLRCRAARSACATIGLVPRNGCSRLVHAAHAAALAAGEHDDRCTSIIGERRGAVPRRGRSSGMSSRGARGPRGVTNRASGSGASRPPTCRAADSNVDARAAASRRSAAMRARPRMRWSRSSSLAAARSAPARG